MPRCRRTEEIKVRVTPEMKAQVLALAAGRQETESVIIREALLAYLASKDVRTAGELSLADANATYGASSPTSAARKTAPDESTQEAAVLARSLKREIRKKTLPGHSLPAAAKVSASVHGSV